MESVSENPLVATFQLSSTASFNLGLSQIGVLGNGLNSIHSPKQLHSSSVFSEIPSAERGLIIYKMTKTFDCQLQSKLQMTIVL